MKHYLFYEKNHNKTIFQYKATYLWLSFAMMMSIMAVIGFITEKQLPILLVLAGLLFFPGVPIAVKNYKKAYYIQLEDMCIVCSGRINNLFRKTRMMYQDIGYVEGGREEPVIYPYGTTREQMVKEFGRYINVYNKDKKYLFSFREKSSIMDILLKKNPHIQIVDRLEDYHV